MVEADRPDISKDNVSKTKQIKLSKMKMINYRLFQDISTVTKYIYTTDTQIFKTAQNSTQ